MSDDFATAIKKNRDKLPGGNVAEFRRKGGVFIQDIFPEAPVTSEAVQPDGFTIKEDGIFMLSSDRDKPPVKLCQQIVLITGRYENITDGSVGLELSWLDDGNWRSERRSRDQFMTKPKLTALADRGLEVSDNNAKNMISYLIAYENANKAAIPKEKGVEQLGYAGKGFLAGKTFIGEGNISFINNDLGDGQLAAAYHSSGDLEGWLTAIEKVKNHPKIMAGVYASFASPLMKVLNENPFVFEYAGESSKGKTTALKILASVWGNPASGGIIKSWNANPVYIERFAAVTNNLPLFLDDTKNAKKKADLPDLIYQLSSGLGKGRGSKTGTQIQKTWNNIIFSTGEQKITTFSRDGGSVTRAIVINGQPFEKIDGISESEMSFWVEDLEDQVKDNYGVAGQAFIRYILQNRDKWEDWRELYKQQKTIYRKLTKASATVSRMAKLMAIIDVACQLFHICFDVKLSGNPLYELWNDIVEDNPEADRPKQALEAVISWSSANETRFIMWDSDNKYKPQNCLGRWDSKRADDLYIYPVDIEDFLESRGYSATAVFNSWRERGWIRTNTGKKTFKRAARMGSGIREQMICIAAETIIDLENL